MGYTTVEEQKEKQNKRFKKLPEEWRNAQMAEKKEAKLYELIGRYAMEVIATKAAKLFDQDLISLKEKVADISAGYSDREKGALLRIEFVMAVLKSRGLDVPSLEDFLAGAAEREPEDTSTEESDEP